MQKPNVITEMRITLYERNRKDAVNEIGKLRTALNRQSLIDKQNKQTKFNIQIKQTDKQAKLNRQIEQKGQHLIDKQNEIDKT